MMTMTMMMMMMRTRAIMKKPREAFPSLLLLLRLH